MPRFTPTDILSQYAAIAAINDNFDNIATLFENCLFRDGTATNSMLANIDMNNYKIQNLANAVNNSEAVNLSQLNAAIAQVTENIEGFPVVTNRTALSLCSTAEPVFLSEGGRSGVFTFDSSNLSARVSADTRQGLFVAPSGAPTGASGAWRRRFDGPVNIRWFGVAADGTTDDYAAFTAAIDALPDRGGTLYVPADKYRLSQTLNIAKPVRIVGDGIGQNPGVVDGVTYTARVDIYHGTRLLFDDNLEGIVFHPHTTEDNADLVAANPNNYYTEWSAFRSGIEDLMVLSAGWTGSVRTYLAGKNGIRTKTVIYASRVWVGGFQDNGFKISATPSGTAGNYGNADLAQFYGCHAIHSGNDGFRIEGADAQVMTLIGCDSSVNGGWGFNDESFLGNNYIGCHAMGNNATGRANADTQIGSFRCSNINACSVYIGCYIENPTTGEICDLSEVCIVIGGIMASARYYSATNKALVLGGSGALRGILGYTNTTGDTTVKGGLGGVPDFSPENTSIWFGSAQESAGASDWRLKYNSVTKTWGMEFGLGGTNTMPFQLPSQGSNWRTSDVYALGCPQGIVMGANGAGIRLFYGTVAPTSGNWLKGDVVFNSDPAVGEGAGWVCTVAGSPGTWVEFGRIHAQGAAVPDLTSTATSGTLPTPDGTVTIANAASPTVTELLEYCVELEKKIEDLLARIRAAGIIAT